MFLLVYSYVARRTLHHRTTIILAHSSRKHDLHKHVTLPKTPHQHLAQLYTQLENTS